jgi:biotin transport system substrate-specific component
VVSTGVAYVLGSAIIYAFGVPVLAVVAGESLGWAVGAGLVPFLLGDGLKALAAAGMLPSAWRLVGGNSAEGERST